MSNSPAPLPSLEAIRARFPALSSDTVFLENAGGSQVPAVVAEAVRDYMLSSYVQLGADYALSKRSTQVVDDAHALVRLLMNGEGSGEVVLGHSCSALCRMLADAYAEILVPGDEIVVAEGGHEANVDPWLRLERRGARIRTWRVDPETGASSLEALEAVLGERTRLVAFPHVSNLLGEIVDVAAATALAHEVGARVVVDGVAYAPHRAMDVVAWDVDYYAYSTYKVYGPHLGALYAKREALAEIPGPNFFFVSERDLPYKFELGGVSHEAAAGLLALGDYLRFLAGREKADSRILDREAVVAAFDVMSACEQPLKERLVGYLDQHPRVRIVGPAHAGEDRVGTISFVHDTMRSREISRAVTARDIGIRHGHMYAYRLCQAMGLRPVDGVVRVSFVHYNTVEEIDRLIAVLDEVM